MIFTHNDCLLHEMGDGHPESPMRLRTVLDALMADEFHPIKKSQAPKATRAQLLLAHQDTYVDQMFLNHPNHGYKIIDGDVTLNPHSLDAALHAAGSGIAAVDAVFQQQSRWAFCAVRPPGHHATPNRAMGFCIFNNIAIAARYAMAQYGIKRVAIVDFDVHHGNGTQDIFIDDTRVLYASTHQSPLYPGTGQFSEKGAGNILNIPLQPGSDGKVFRHAIDHIIAPAIRAHQPELILISAGFDAHRLDPLASLNLDADDFDHATLALIHIANECAQGRIISMLEGGYSITALRACVASHVRVLSRGN